MSLTETTAPPHETVWTVTTSLVSARALHVVAELGVADHLDAQAVSVQELAARCEVDPDALDRALRLLATHGIFGRQGDGYRHTDASRLLRDDHPMSMRAFARMIGLPVIWSSFAGLDVSVRTGAPAVGNVEPRGFWAYLHAHPGEARIFDQAMTAKARADIAAVLAAYDFRPFRTVADVGGGRGHLLQAVLDGVPGARGVLFDLPDVIGTLDVRSERLTPQAGDFFVDALPAADAYLLMEVVHDWPDPEAAAILGAVRRAAHPGAVVLIVESVVPEDHEDLHVNTLDLIMLAVTGGRERTAAEHARLLHGAGFRLSAVVETAGPLRIVEAIAV